MPPVSGAPDWRRINQKPFEKNMPYFALSRDIHVLGSHSEIESLLGINPFLHPDILIPDVKQVSLTQKSSDIAHEKSETQHS